MKCFIVHVCVINGVCLFQFTDQDDNYYSPDPDRFSAETLVFDTTSGTHVYPTADAEMNLLIDNTLYSKYLYYSLSGGEYKTWRKDEGPFNIEYNLSMANAYFDGEWGIHFGTGFITDDVVAHGEWEMVALPEVGYVAIVVRAYRCVSVYPCVCAQQFCTHVDVVCTELSVLAEWSHGYTQTGADLIYKGQTGSMNEGFSDIFGESIDILNKDSADTTVPRAASPASCTSTMNSRTGTSPFCSAKHVGDVLSVVISSNSSLTLVCPRAHFCRIRPSPRHRQRQPLVHRRGSELLSLEQR